MDENTNKNTSKIDSLNEALVKLKSFEQIELPSEGYLASFDNWLLNRIDDWEKNSLRIGLVGITSAGKSTFINALAGEDILPRGAQPTSGILVVCRKSTERKLKILFKDKNEYGFDGEECNNLWVKRYADEAENPNNEQNVEEMHLYLPDLMIPEKYDLIDSPGLDAFGLQGHEELTLRTLIPLVDVILFLTTTKSTSDRENLKALAKICREAKPAIVVQTHKDAVEARYGKGGKIIETEEEVLEKHQNRVKNLLEQTIGLENSHIIQVSSIQALNVRQKNKGVNPENFEEWHESGFHEVTAVLEKLHEKVSQKIAGKRLRLLLNETQNLVERVKMDYFTVRGKEKEAEYYREQERSKLDELQSSIPIETEEQFPNLVKLQENIQNIKTFFTSSLENWSEEDLEELPSVVRDKIKSIENQFFSQSDIVEERLQKIAEGLSIDLKSTRPDPDNIPDIPQLKRYEETVRVEVLEQAGMSAKMKRWVGKLFKKEDWGYSEREVSETHVDRDALKEDITDYHSLYIVQLNNYLKTWSQNWFQSVGAILTIIAQKKDELNTTLSNSDPEPYRILLNQVRIVRDWLETTLQDGKKGHNTMGFGALKYQKRQNTLHMTTTRTSNYAKMALPILHACRTLTFNYKTYRFWHVCRQISQKDTFKVLISTPFSQEIIDYLTIIGDLTLTEEQDLYNNIIIYGSGLQLATTLPLKHISTDTKDQRENWFLQKTQVILVHDKILEMPDAYETFEQLAGMVDIVWRAVDFHQIGHERARLNKLPIKEILESNKKKLAYIAMGANRLIKGGQFIDAFKSYQALKNPPGYGLRPFVLSDGEELLTSLLWLATSLENKNTVSDEIRALEILTRTQPQNIEGREGFIRNFFKDVKLFQGEQKIHESFEN